jgi:hypothetical protein
MPNLVTRSLSAMPEEIEMTFLASPLRINGMKRLNRWMLPTTLVVNVLTRSSVRWLGSAPSFENGSKADHVGRYAALAMRQSSLPEIILLVASAASYVGTSLAMSDAKIVDYLHTFIEL